MPTVTKPPILDSTGQAIVTALGNVSIRPQIVDNCTTADSTKALSANQGKVLNDKINALQPNVKARLVWSSDTYDLSNVDISFDASDAEFLALEYYMNGWTRGGMCLISLHPTDYGTFNITYFGSDTGDFATGSPMMWVRELSGITRTGMHIGPTYGIYIRNNNTLTGFNYHVKPGRIYSIKIV